MKFGWILSIIAFSIAGVCSGQAAEVVSLDGASGTANSVASVFGTAKPMEMPMLTKDQLERFRQQSPHSGVPKQARTPRHTKGFAGGPVREPIQIVPVSESKAGPTPSMQAGVAPPEVGTSAYGESGIPFSTSRVDSNPKRADTSKLFPYRAAGLLGVKMPEGYASCSAALIDKGILLTAAHCVVKFGGPRYSGFVFIPGYYKGKGAYGVFRGRRAYVKASYAHGTEVCYNVTNCENDLALIVLKPNAEQKYPGELTGWFQVGIDGFGFTAAGETQVTQLGYPGNLDRGRQMIRNDSRGFVRPEASHNTIIGSPMLFGSSGGPWVVNLGTPPVYSTPEGADSVSNVIIGVASWAVGDDGASLELGASPLTSNNILKLYDAACRDYPDACSEAP